MIEKILLWIVERLPFSSWLKRDLSDKVVDLNYPEKSGLSSVFKKDGFILYWSAEDKVNSRMLDGWEYAYESKNKWWRCKLKTKDGLYLLKKKR